MGRLNEHKNIYEIISKQKNIIWVEIGVRFGNNAKWILDEFNINKIYLIDPYCELDYMKNLFNESESKKNKKTAHDKLENYKNKITWLEDFSENVVDTFKDNYIDVLYIDGNHAYQAVLDDLNNFYPKVKEGGLIIGDDYNEKGVKKAIIEFSEKNNIKYHESINSSDTDKFWFIK